MYHFNYQVWGILFSFGNFRARDVCTISTTKCGAFCFLLGIFVHTTYVPWLLDNTGACLGSPQLFRKGDFAGADLGDGLWGLKPPFTFRLYLINMLRIIVKFCRSIII